MASWKSGCAAAAPRPRNPSKSAFARAVEEMEYAVDYNEVVINDTVDECAEEIYSLIQKYQQEEE